MTVKILNQDAAVFDQVDGQWMKLLAMVVWKLAPKGVEITAADIASFPPDGTLVTHGHRESFEFRIVTEEEAKRLAAHDAATNRGRA